MFVLNTSTQNDVVSVKQEEAFYRRKINQQEKKSKYRRSSFNKLNPVMKNGQTFWCIVSDSKMHWASNCPCNPQYLNILEDELDNCEEVNIVLITEDLNKNKIFVV